jgi:type IV pilus assembly protein PilQ
VVTTGRSALELERRPDAPLAAVTLQVENVELADALRAFERASGFTVVPADPLDARVSFRLEEVPWDEALEELLATAGFGFEKVGGFLLVYRRGS